MQRVLRWILLYHDRCSTLVVFGVARRFHDMLTVGFSCGRVDFEMLLWVASLLYVMGMSYCNVFAMIRLHIPRFAATADGQRIWRGNLALSAVHRKTDGKPRRHGYPLEWGGAGSMTLSLAGVKKIVDEGYIGRATMVQGGHR